MSCVGTEYDRGQMIESPVFSQKDKAKEDTREGRTSTQRKRQMTLNRQESKEKRHKKGPGILHFHK